MHRNTYIFILFLVIFASLLIGINIGKKIGISQSGSQKQPFDSARDRQIDLLPTVTITPIPTTSSFLIPTRTSAGSSTQVLISGNISTFTDEYCGFSLSYAGTYMNQNTNDGGSTISTDPDDPTAVIVTTCQQEIPKPPLPPEKIEDITIDGVNTKLYHDTNSRDGSPRDEVIVRHPTNGMDIIVAGFGPTYDEAISNFKFIRN